MKKDMEQRRRNLLLAFILSVLLHFLLILWMKADRWWDMGMAKAAPKIPQEMVITFPENKPEERKEIVENLNENEELPDRTNLLSERTSRAKNPERSAQTGETPQSEGNTPFSNLSRPSAEEQTLRQPAFRKFTSRALTGTRPSEDLTERGENDRADRQPSQSSLGTNQNLDQKNFSVEELGSLSLSTYRWSYAPYVNALRRKLYRVWNVPPAFYMGLISGYSVIVFEITKDGNLKNIKLIEHNGHESLEIASMESIKALFPFLPLPDDFPDETLMITAKLHYPNLKDRR